MDEQKFKSIYVALKVESGSQCRGRIIALELTRIIHVGDKEVAMILQKLQ